MIEIRQDRAGAQSVDVVTLTAGTLRAVLTNLGAKLIELHVPDRDGVPADVVLQRASLTDMATDPNYFGATAGRYANRIRYGRLQIDGQHVQLSINEGRHHLHGGVQGFDRHLWTTEPGTDERSVTFRRTSPDGEEGYPGALEVAVTYRLEPSALGIEIRATTSAPTVANIVHHSYVNLAGHGSGPVLDHLLQVNGSFYVPVDDELLPTGEVLAVAGTPFDFRRPTPIGLHLAEVQNSGAGRAATGGVGYDHNWVLEGVGMREVLVLTDPRTGRRLRLSANQPGVQVYVGGYLEGVTAKGPVGRYAAFAGLTMETQTFPDAVNHSHFPQALLRPGETYENLMRFDFSVVDDDG